MLLKNIRDHSKIEITQTWRYNYIDKNGERTSTTSPETYTCEVPSDVSRKLRANFVYDSGVVEVSLLHV